jgi:hypothetical protein
MTERWKEVTSENLYKALESEKAISLVFYDHTDLEGVKKFIMGWLKEEEFLQTKLNVIDSNTFEIQVFTGKQLFTKITIKKETVLPKPFVTINVTFPGEHPRISCGMCGKLML